ncbi:hypothetical protein CROQUDRAFT_135928 [Cronartium quercuum f. sp. fusiforme G11]|uniref:Uncharacterized protein n=1 Tax=Cronartium quercuum f. sp. fusiforme G11 TaxID=708437 RepID=A0A9P6ND58_9BASI|nr:hypothetical protein CROQUDRAFT_135928 [Cronartium quercuum f. sp. fusiforme G11]
MFLKVLLFSLLLSGFETKPMEHELIESINKCDLSGSETEPKAIKTRTQPMGQSSKISIEKGYYPQDNLLESFDPMRLQMDMTLDHQTQVEAARVLSGLESPSRDRVEDGIRAPISRSNVNPQVVGLADKEKDQDMTTFIGVENNSHVKKGVHENVIGGKSSVIKKPNSKSSKRRMNHKFESSNHDGFIKEIEKVDQTEIVQLPHNDLNLLNSVKKDFQTVKKTQKIEKEEEDSEKISKLTDLEIKRQLFQEMGEQAKRQQRWKQLCKSGIIFVGILTGPLSKFFDVDFNQFKKTQMSKYYDTNWFQLTHSE